MTAFGGTFLRIETLEADGTSKAHHYSASSLFSWSEITEEQARRIVVPLRPWPCSAFEESPVLPGACKACGRAEQEHVTVAQLGEHRDTDEEEDATPDSGPY